MIEPSWMTFSESALQQSSLLTDKDMQVVGKTVPPQLKSAVGIFGPSST